MNKFIDIKEQISEYEDENNIVVPLALVLTREAKDDLIAEYGNGMSIVQFNQLDDDTVDAMISKRALPKSRAQWLLFQSLSCKFGAMEKYYPTVQNFGKFLTRCTTYKIRFIVVYDYLAKCDPKFIPHLTRNKKSVTGNEKSLVNLFLDGIPHRVGPQLHDLLVDVAVHKTIHEYCDYFISQLRLQRDKCIDLLPLSDIMHKWRQESGDNKYREVSSLSFLDDSNDTAEKESQELYFMDVQRRHEKKHPDGGPAAACYVEMRGRECPNGDKCKYSHDPIVLDAARAAAVKELTSVVLQAENRSLQDPEETATRPAHQCHPQSELCQT